MGKFPVIKRATTLSWSSLLIMIPQAKATDFLLPLPLKIKQKKMKNEGAAKIALCSPVSLQLPLPLFVLMVTSPISCSLPYRNTDYYHPRQPIVILQLPSAPTKGHRSFVASSFGLARPYRSSFFPSFSSFSVVPIDHKARRPHRLAKPTDEPSLLRLLLFLSLLQTLFIFIP
ncbi:unnamed protein product [Lactuca saligna]|uniref:Uncharacterized protein n=1 Tax=Lactuca saligna TaxID=75948 RepID=A0AA36EDT6_LACSI|nr:unnamed protein product [Lactuca saligna]